MKIERKTYIGNLIVEFKGTRRVKLTIEVPTKMIDVSIVVDKMELNKALKKGATNK